MSAELLDQDDAGVGAGQVEQGTQLAIKSDGRPTQAGRGPALRTWLRTADAIAASVGWLAVLVFDGPPEMVAGRMVLAAVGTLALVAAAAQRKLYLTRACVVVATELRHIAQAALLSGIAVLLASTAMGAWTSVGDVVDGTVATFAALVGERAVFRWWLREERRRGNWLRRVIVVGGGPEAADIAALFRRHPEAGFSVVGFVARADAHELLPGVRWLGPTTDCVRAASLVQATGAVIACSDVTPAELNLTARRLLSAGLHVQLSGGLRGLAHHRVSIQPVAREPFLSLERTTQSLWQQVVKRSLDIGLSLAGLVASLPLVALAALAIKIEDGGPVVFRQQRVGRDGVVFTVFKLRTMVIDAEHRLAELQLSNERTGPLFKLASDPRVTRTGRFLRQTSIDELPQLWNVVRGDMSLVGPRPALPDEARHFDERLRQRTAVRPGVTGLWQVECRDDPSFLEYRRLDVFYVENWSLTLDLVILAATLVSVLRRAVSRGKPASAFPADAEVAMW